MHADCWGMIMMYRCDYIKEWNGKKRRKSEIRCMSPSLMRLSCCPLVICTFSVLFFSPLSIFLSVRLLFLPVIPFFFSPPRTPSPTSYSHCCIHRACLYSVSGSLALSRGWHCAMVVEGLCPDASWLSVWDFRRLDQRREVKWEKGGKRGLLRREKAKSWREKGKREKMD